MKIGACPAEVIVLSQHGDIRRDQPTRTQQHAHTTVEGHAAKNTSTELGRNTHGTSLHVQGAVQWWCKLPTVGPELAS
jgi:hypothetical protein